MIEDVNRFNQKLDFRGLDCERKITPTDIDGSMDFRGNLFIFFESKLKGTEMKNGQRMHYQYLVDAIGGNNEKAAYCLIFEHEVYDTKEHIIASGCTISNYYCSFTHEWRQPKIPTIIADAITKIKDYCKKKNINI